MTAEYSDDDLVYVDPETRTVVSKVEFNASGEPKALEMVMKAKNEEGKEEERKEGDKAKAVEKRRFRKRYYPWGTYKTMKKLYRIGGKEKEIESYKKLEDALKLAIEEPYWE